MTTVFLQAAPGGGMSSLIFMLIILGLFWFLMMRPQRKREKELKAQIAAMKVGDKVMTIGGIVGKVMNVTGDEVTISTSAANTLMTFKISAISQVVSPEMEARAKAAAAERAAKKEEAGEKKGLFGRKKKDEE